MKTWICPHCGEQLFMTPQSGFCPKCGFTSNREEVKTNSMEKVLNGRWVTWILAGVVSAVVIFTLVSVFANKAWGTSEGNNYSSSVNNLEELSCGSQEITFSGDSNFPGDDNSGQSRTQYRLRVTLDGSEIYTQDGDGNWTAPAQLVNPGSHTVVSGVQRRTSNSWGIFWTDWVYTDRSGDEDIFGIEKCQEEEPTPTPEATPSATPTVKPFDPLTDQEDKCPEPMSGVQSVVPQGMFVNDKGLCEDIVKTPASASTITELPATGDNSLVKYVAIALGLISLGTVGSVWANRKLSAVR